MNKILIPFTVTREERAKIQEAYIAGRDAADGEMIEYIFKNLPSVIKRLRGAEVGWMVELATAAEGLFDLLKSPTLSKAGQRDVTSALHYLCNPFEVIPDYIPGRGYADDALVINACIVSLRQRGAVEK